MTNHSSSFSSSSSSSSFSFSSSSVQCTPPQVITLSINLTNNI
jgi:hypothetical protein